MGLTNKQAAFVEHYLACWNATEAARRAGYSSRTATMQGSRLLTKANVHAAISARLAELKMSADEVLTRLADHARSSVEAFLDESNGIDLARARAASKLHLVHKLKRTTRVDMFGNSTTKVEVELYDAQAALVQLGRHHGLFLDRMRHEDWRTDVVELLRQGKVKPAEVVAEFGNELAQDLFRQAGQVRVASGVEDATP